MEIDLAPAVQALAPLALAALTAAVPYALVLARRAIGLKFTSQQQSSVIAAVDGGAQAAYGFLVTNGGSVLNTSIRNTAIATGANHVLADVGPALKALNITPERVHAMVDARLGGLLATDPTVSVGAAASGFQPLNSVGASIALSQGQPVVNGRSGDVEPTDPAPNGTHGSPDASRGG